VFEQLFGIIFAFRWTGAALAAAVMGFPLMVRAIRLSLEAIDHGLEEAAGTLGASRLRVLRTITLPLAWPGILAGAVLGFAKGMGEFGATVTFVSNIPGQTQTLALSIDTLLEVPGGEPLALRLAIVSIAIAAVALIVSELLAQRVTRRRAM
jgi:molybdate transport system permease protein